MIGDGQMPPELAAALAGDRAHFAVQGRREHKRSTVIAGIVIGLVLVLFDVGIASSLLVPILQGETVSMTINDQPRTVSRENWTVLLAPLAVISVFGLVGLLILVRSLMVARRPGSWFAGTDHRLIIAGRKGARSIDWEQFSGDIELEGSPERASIALGLRTGTYSSSGTRSRGGVRVGGIRFGARRGTGDGYVPERIHLVEVPHAPEIEAFCRKQIKANDPTPAAAGP